MARAKRTIGALWLASLLVAVVLAAGAWLLWSRGAGDLPPLAGEDGNAALVVAADQVDPANEGRLVTISGTLRAEQAARDTQLGVAADAVALLRTVEMRQWQETCTPDGCDYKLAWSAQPVDSHAFREAGGHANPARFPFASERFVADGLRLGAFGIDPALAADGIPALAHAVDTADLPPNLAATFRAHDGVLLAAADAQSPAAGDLRVSYRIIAAGERRLTGVQEGSKLRAPHQ